MPDTSHPEEFSMKTIALSVLALGALAACAAAPGEARLRGIEKYAGDPRLGDAVDQICFASTIDGFSMNGRETVLLHEGRDRYMVEVAAGCLDLEFAETIALASTLSCLSRGDALIIRHASGGGLGPQRCLIREIRKWNPKAGQAEAEAGENPA
ncbi:MAG: DUF6491 family protein [Hyphomonas sp.]